MTWKYPQSPTLGKIGYFGGAITVLVLAYNFCVDMVVCIGQLAAEYWDNLVEEYGAQLAAYALAIEKASGRKVLESWLFLPVASGATQLTA